MVSLKEDTEPLAYTAISNDKFFYVEVRLEMSREGGGRPVLNSQVPPSIGRPLYPISTDLCYISRGDYDVELHFYRLNEILLPFLGSGEFPISTKFCVFFRTHHFTSREGICINYLLLNPLLDSIQTLKTTRAFFVQSGRFTFGHDRCKLFADGSFVKVEGVLS